MLKVFFFKSSNFFIWVISIKNLIKSKKNLFL